MKKMIFVAVAMAILSGCASTNCRYDMSSSACMRDVVYANSREATAVMGSLPKAVSDIGALFEVIGNGGTSN